MTTRSSRIADAERKARRQLDLTLDDIRERRVALDARQIEVAEVLGCSRQWVSLMERGAVADLGVLELARLSAAVGLDLSIKTFPGASVLRDIGQVGVLGRSRARQAGVTTTNAAFRIVVQAWVVIQRPSSLARSPLAIYATPT